MKDWDPNAGGSGREVLLIRFTVFIVYNYNASLGINTKIYGMYNPIFLPKEDTDPPCHNPSVSISAAPGFWFLALRLLRLYIKNYADGRRDTVVYSPMPVRRLMFREEANREI